MAQAATEAAAPATISRLANQLWPFLLVALDARQASMAPSDSQPSPSGSDTDPAAVEAAATALLVAVTLKLSEARFKPLFLRLQAWASVPPPQQAGTLLAVAEARVLHSIGCIYSACLIGLVSASAAMSDCSSLCDWRFTPWRNDEGCLVRRTAAQAPPKQACRRLATNSHHP